MGSRGGAEGAEGGRTDRTSRTDRSYGDAPSDEGAIRGKAESWRPGDRHSGRVTLPWRFSAGSAASREAYQPTSPN